MTDNVLRISDYERRPRPEGEEPRRCTLHLFPIRRIRRYRSGCSWLFREGWACAIKHGRPGSESPQVLRVVATP